MLLRYARVSASFLLFHSDSASCKRNSWLGPKAETRQDNKTYVHPILKYWLVQDKQSRETEHIFLLTIRVWHYGNKKLNQRKKQKNECLNTSISLQGILYWTNRHLPHLNCPHWCQAAQRLLQSSRKTLGPWGEDNFHLNSISYRRQQNLTGEYWHNKLLRGSTCTTGNCRCTRQDGGQ